MGHNRVDSAAAKDVVASAESATADASSSFTNEPGADCGFGGALEDDMCKSDIGLEEEEEVQVAARLDELRSSLFSVLNGLEIPFFDRVHVSSSYLAVSQLLVMSFIINLLIFFLLSYHFIIPPCLDTLLQAITLNA
jgi:hypothetical protein